MIIDKKIISKVQELTKFYLDKIIKIRETIHANPELGWEEKETSKLIQSELKKKNIPFTLVRNIGIIGLIKGTQKSNKKEKTILLRADMDALPLQEEVKISYASKVKNKMHACGHDAHTANLLGCALILNDMKNQFSGNIKLMFQPSEEVGEGGAKPMIDAGILKNPTVDAAIGLHVSGSTEIGNIELSRGKSSAAVDDFKITINAVGGHVSRPHNSANPCFIASQFVAGINSIIDKAVNPLKLPLVGICVIRGGEEGANNVIPTSTFIEGTTRSFDNSIRKDIPKIMEKYLQGLCLSAPTKATYKIDYLFLYPPLINDDKMVDLIYDVSTNLLGKNKFHYKPEGFGAEDFAYLTQNVPSVFYYVGVKDPKNKTQCCSVHSGTFSFDSKQFFTTAIPTMVISALEYLLK